MKTQLAVILALVIPMFAPAEPPTALTNYFTEGVIVPASCTNTGVTGMSTGVVYFAIKIDEITNATYTAAMLTNDIQSLTPNFARFVQAQIGTNVFTYFTMVDNTEWEPVSDTNIYKTTHRIMSSKQEFLLTE